MTLGGKKYGIGHGAVVLLAGALFISACAGSATISERADQTDPVKATSTEVPPQDVEPTAVPPASTAVEPTTAQDPQGPTPEVAAPLPAAAEFRSESIVGLSADAAFVYAGTTDIWNPATPCDASPAESLAVIDVVQAAQGDINPIGAGLLQAGDVRQFVVSNNGQVAILSSCGSTFWINTAVIGADGRLTNVSENIQFNAAENESDPYLLAWVDDDTVEARVIVEVDPDNFDTWLIQRRSFSVATGQIVATEVFNYYDEAGFENRAELTTEAGNTYRVIDDPAGRLGCEGFGVARTIELDDGDVRRLALGDDRLAFSDVNGIHVSSTGHIAWTSGCEGFTSAFVGKLLPNGLIADAHLIDTFSPSTGSYSDYQHYQLSNDGFLVGVGSTYNNATGETSGPAILRHDLGADPSFINTADPALAINDEPLLVAIDGVSSWHVGETLAANRACGGKTLYRRGPAGFSRALQPGIEMDAIVDANTAAVVRASYFEGNDYVSRTVVVSTICPGEYEGHRVWFGNETEWDIWFERADMDDVRKVLSVRDVFAGGRDFPEASFVEVELFDGTVTEIELVALLPQN